MTSHSKLVQSLDAIQQSCKVPLRYYAIEGETRVCAWTDGSWAARVDGRSQGAMLVGFVSEAFMRAAPVWLLSALVSYRVARSRLATECQTTVLGQEESEYLWRAGHGFIEQTSLPGCVVTDSKGLYDSLARNTSSALGLSDRKMAIEALAL